MPPRFAASVIVEHALELRQHPLERVAGRRLGGLAVAGSTGLEQRVRPAAEVGERLRVAAEGEHVALDAHTLVLQRPLEPRPVGAAVAGVAQRPEGGEVGVEVAGPEGALHLVAGSGHLGERLAR